MGITHPLKVWREGQTPPLTQEGASTTVGVSKAAWSRWETGMRKIDEDLLLLVATKTGIPARVLRPDLAELMTEAAE